MTEIQLGIIRSNVKTIRWMLSQASPSSPEVVLELDQDEVSTVATSGAGSVTSCCTFNRDFFDDVNLVGDVQIRAMINLFDITSFLKYFKQSDTLELRFFGPDPSSVGAYEVPIAEWLIIDSGLKSWKPLPAAKSNFTDHPPELCSRFTQQNKFMNQDKTRTYPIEFQISSEKAKKLVGITNNLTHDNTINPIYPLRIKDGELIFPEWIFEDQSGIIFHSFSVPDENIEQYYTSEFEEIIQSMEGNITLSTHPTENLLIFIQQGHRNCTIRHIMEAVDLPREVFNTLISV